VLSDPNLTETLFPSDAASSGRSGPVETTDTSAVFLKDIVRRAVETAEREAIGKMLEHTGWNRVRTAKLLNISYRALLYKMKRSELQRMAPPASSTF
jgi:DNA-binding NtrC family response regulator